MLAGSVTEPSIKEDLVILANRCDQLAVRMARQISDRMQQPIDGKRTV